jgi:hypothetical protein
MNANEVIANRPLNFWARQVDCLGRSKRGEVLQSLTKAMWLQDFWGDFGLVWSSGRFSTSSTRWKPQTLKAMGVVIWYSWPKCLRGSCPSSGSEFSASLKLLEMNAGTSSDSVPC